MACCHEHYYPRDGSQGQKECGGLPQKFRGAAYYRPDTVGQPHVCRQWQPSLWWLRDNDAILGALRGR